ncbi:MAG: LysE family translocator [Alphaproteobacteria bacterium]|nr:LysE family translocator [Alphaproteobacteria bacterium]
MDLDRALAFAAFAFAAAATPGPSNTLLAAVGAQVGLLRGIPCLLGVSVGMASLLFTVGLGVTQTLLAQPSVLAAIRIAGAAFLLWLAWRIATGPAGAASAPRATIGLVAAAALQWVNPKAWMVGAGAATTYLAANPPSAVAQAAALAGIFVTVALPAGMTWLAFGAVLQRFLRDERRGRLFNVAMGALLAVSVFAMLR